MVLNINEHEGVDRRVCCCISLEVTFAYCMLKEANQKCREALVTKTAVEVCDQDYSKRAPHCFQDKDQIGAEEAESKVRNARRRKKESRDGGA